MRENLTEIVFILDRSGSMSNLTDDTIGGYNSFIQKQKETDGEAVLTTVLFDDKYEVLHDRIDIRDVQPMTRDEYFARGMTAMLDAIGKTINDIGDKLRNTEDSDRPSKVIFVITTDGMENASKEFNRQQVKDMITHQSDKYSWEFIFLGANIDSVAEAENIGIQGTSSCNYVASSDGLNTMYCTVAKTVSNYRSTGTIAPDWAYDLSTEK